jgi:ribokinase
MIVVAGSLNMDLVGRVPRLPGWGETVMGESFSRFAGGKGGNQAVAAARLGAKVAFAGAVGDDPFGDELRQGLAAEGIDTSGLATVPSATGCALIHVRPDGDNAISVLPGANAHAPLPPATWPAAWRFLVLQLEIPLATALAWARAARAAGATVLLNAAPMQPLPPALLDTLDLLVVNEVELLALVGRQPSVPVALEAAARLGPPRVVATLGAHGCLAWDCGLLLQQPGRPAAVVDSTGAGDTFVGALAASMSQRRPFTQALARANAAAAYSCTRPGARGGMPTLAELDNWIATSEGP